MFWEKDNAISTIEELALFHRRKGNYPQARSLYTCLLAMITKTDGPESERLALNFYRLAETYSDEGKFDAAQTYYERAAETWSKTHPNKEESMLWYGNALARMHQIAGQQDDAAAANLHREDVA